MAAAVARWTFGEFVLDLDARELLRAGRALPLSPKAFTLLGILVENRERALSKGELQDRLWPGTFVVEKNLTNLIAEIREALGDDPVRSMYIRTVARFGYAFRGTAAPEAGIDRAPSHNLPQPLTAFVGRCAEIAELSELLGSTRLLTLTGAGGCGKTRLALELAHRFLDSRRDGVWLVDLAPLSDPSLVPQTAAVVLNVRQIPGRTIVEALTEYCRGRQLILILDNCEHVIAPCAALAETLLHASPQLTILVTSREALGIAGETVWRVPSLMENEAVDLFVERGAAAAPQFAPAGAHATIAAVCRRLDGIPLAIELAAARLRVLSIDQINARLNDRFRLLTGGSRTAVARQRTLEAAVGWSYDLLAEPERLLLRRLSVFAGKWTLDAAEHVCSERGIARSDVLDLLSRLVDKSLVLVDADAPGDPRYRFLETVRQYARERLVESGDAERMRDRHLAFFLDVARRWEPDLTRANQVSLLEQMQRELDNLRLALECSLAAPSHATDALHLAAALFLFWLKRAYFAEGQQWLERALAANDSAGSALQATALMALANMTFFQGDFPRTRELARQAAALGRTAGDRFVTSMALGVGSLAELELGNLPDAQRLAAAGRQEGAASDTPWIQGPSLACLAYIALDSGDTTAACGLHEEALRLLRAQGEIWATSIVLFDVALLNAVQGRFAEARALCSEAVVVCQQFGDTRGIGYCLGILAGAEAAEGHPLRAARLRGAMDGVLETVSAPVQPTYDKWIGERYFPAVKDSLGEAQFQAALAEGRTMSMDQALELARQSLEPQKAKAPAGESRRG